MSTALPDLATLRRLHEAATRGPWKAVARLVDGEFVHAAGEYLVMLPDNNDLSFMEKADAELIAASRNALLDLLDAAEFRAQVQGMKYRLEILRQHFIGYNTTLDDLLALIDAPPKET